MKFGVDFSEPSTIRGLILLVGAVFLGIGWLQGKDVTPVLTIVFGSSGLVGFFTKSDPDK